METLWSDFLNSEWHDWRGSGRSEDRLEKPAWQERLLRDWHLAAPVPMPAEDVKAMRRFREQLRALAVELAEGGEMEEGDWRLLNEHLAPDAVTRRLIGGPGNVRLEYIPMTEDWHHVRAEIASSFGETLIGGEAGRIRVCDNSDCRWIFYDDTRNRTKKYCDDKMCGNLMKVRRFRARKKAGIEQGEE
ncbi:CGNR zinc finger domain-containing protein [uncultured Paenibacillus sp.]|uniref:CGNR zinc finger domain-containing protein n=1 Tax=uncultured Paenibacillus sp. TaxID=227322 RepID=UPI0015A8DDA9|nr:CGNR zinc finger domain-containing protein [uncultured Paenibacillus sp.]